MAPNDSLYLFIMVQPTIFQFYGAAKAYSYNHYGFHFQHSIQ